MPNPVSCARSRALRFVLVMLALVALAAVPLSAQVVFVNEIHYDNTGTDAGEAIEIAAPGGTDLAGWSLVLYNGSGGAVYNTLALSGVVPVQEGGYGVLSFAYPVNGIQNGAPDGLALVDPGSVVVELLSYEGTFTAVGGPAGGMLTTDIGVAETGSEPVGLSLQRVGSGDEATDFVWTSPVAASFGLPNDGQSFGGAAGDPKLNEVVANHLGTDTHEYVEVLGDADTDYSAFTVLQLDGDTTASGSIDSVLAVGTTDAGGFWTTGFLSNELENGTLTLLLVEAFAGADGQDLDAADDGVLDVEPWDRVVDCVALSDGGAADRAYCATVLAPGFDGDAFTPGGASRFPNGADTDSAADWRRNDFDGDGLPGFGVGSTDYPEAFNTPGAANDAPPPPPPDVPALVVNEIDYDQASTDTAEFVEILNAGGEPVDLDPFAVVLVNGNGGGAAVYDTIDLPAVVLLPGEYFVVCANAANTPNCDLDDGPDTNFVQNGSPDAVAIVLGEAVVDAVSYGGDTGAPYTEGTGAGLLDSAAAFTGISRFPDGTDTGANNVDLSQRCITPGEANVVASTSCPPPGSGGFVTVEIFEIQGAGLASPFAGQGVETLDNVVTAVAADGFFVQTPDARADADVETSNGIFVFTGSAPAVAVGDLVDVTGTASEFFDFTEISGAVTVTVDSSGSPLPAAVAFDAATPSPDQPVAATGYERYESMRVAVASGVVGGPNQRFGPDPLAEVHVTASGVRAFREPGILFPGLPGLPVWDGNPEVFELDPDRLGLPNAEIPAGSTFAAEGVLGFEFGGFELWPTTLAVDPAPLPVPVRDRALGEHAEYAIGSLNLFRLFDSVDDPAQPSASFPDLLRDDDGGDPDYPVRLAKLARYVLEVLRAPDVLAVQEAEKLEVLEALAAEIALQDAGVVYTAYLVEGNDVGTIDTGFLVRDTTAVLEVAQLGAGETLSLDGSALHDRPPLLLVAQHTAAGPSQPFGVLALHQRSLGGIEDPSDGPRVRQKRLEQAESVAAMVQGLQELEPPLPLAVVGDFNAFEFSDGYVDVVGHVVGDFDPAESLLSGADLVEPNLENQVLSLPAEQRYSFVFGGSAQVLDHALTSAALAPFVRGFEYGRGNADAALQRLDDPTTPLRSSDHDGLVLFVEVDDDGIPDDHDLCPGTAIPEDVPTIALKPNHYALVDGDTMFDAGTPPGQGAGESDLVFTLSDTGGCSCEQIIEQLGLGNGPRKFGCPVDVMEQWVESVP